MRFLTLSEVLELHRLITDAAGGATSIRDLGALESALAQPRMTFASEDLYPSLADKAAALGFSLICNHPFIDGNKRVGHAAIETFIMLNGYELDCTIDDAEQLILGVASGTIARDGLVTWISGRMVRLEKPG